MGNFAKVARKHNIDPSSVSRIIAQLEEELGLRLFQRTTRRLALTESGAVYSQRVETLLEELERACDDAKAISDAPSGILRMTASVSFGQMRVVPLMPEFRRLYPNVKLELLLTDSHLDLVSERIDLAVRLGSTMKQELCGTRVCKLRYHLCASTDYVATMPALRCPEDLAKHRCLLYAVPGLHASWSFQDGSGQRTEITVNGDVAMSSPLALRDCALAGMGPALLANWLIQADLQQGRLVDLLPAYTATISDFETGIWLLYPSRAFVPQKVRAMLAFLRQRLSTRAAPQSLV